MEPLVPAMTASFGSRVAIEKEQKAILFLENFITTTTDSSTPAKKMKLCQNQSMENEWMNGNDQELGGSQRTSILLYL